MAAVARQDLANGLRRNIVLVRVDGDENAAVIDPAFIEVASSSLTPWSLSMPVRPPATAPAPAPIAAAPGIAELAMAPAAASGPTPGIAKAATPRIAPIPAPPSAPFTVSPRLLRRADARARSCRWRGSERDWRPLTPCRRPQPDPAAVYFRAAQHGVRRPRCFPPWPRRLPSRRSPPSSDLQDARGHRRFPRGCAGWLPGRPLALLEGHASEQSPSRAFSTMDYAREHEENTYFTRSHELAFLTNTLIAGCAVQSAAFHSPGGRPRRSSASATSPSSNGQRDGLGASTRAARERSDSVPDTFLLNHDFVTTFESGLGGV